MLSRIGSISSPYILLLADYTFPEFPFLIFGSFTLVSGILMLVLPDTMGVKLPETMQEGEDFGKNMSLREMFKLPNCRLPSYSSEESIFDETMENDKETVVMEMNTAYSNVAVQTDD